MNVRKALFLAIVCLWLVTCLSLVVLFLRPQPAATFQGHTDSIDEVVSSPDGTKLASASRDKTIKLWDVATGKERATLRGHTDRWCHCASAQMARPWPPQEGATGRSSYGTWPPAKSWALSRDVRII